MAELDLVDLYQGADVGGNTTSNNSSEIVVSFSIERI
jgi:hypothetical protein